MNKRVLALLALLLVPSSLSAQQAVRALPTDGDDGSIASGQTQSNTNAINMAFDGSVWRRVTFGSAGTASSQVWTVQGIASMTPLATNLTQVSGATQSATNPLAVRLSDGSAFITSDTQLTHDGAMTPGSTTGGAQFFRASAAAPTDVSADADAVLPWALRNGSLVVNLASGGTLVGVNGSGNSANVQCTSGCSGGAQYVHDAALTIGSTSTTVAGGRASAAAPTDVSADNDAVAAWYLRSGAQVVNPSYGGTLASTGNGASGGGVLRVTVANDSTGIIALAAGTNLVGQAATVATATTTNTTSSCYITSAGTTNATNCKGSAGNLYSIQAINTTATLYYLRLYNLASAPTCSSATGFIRTVPVPSSTSGAGVVIPEDVGEAFGTGIGFCLTGGGSSTDNTNAAAGLYITLLYK